MLTRIHGNNQYLLADRIEPNDLNQKLPSYFDGQFDGKTNLDPLFPENWDYWEGYSQGNRQYWCQQKGITLPEEF